MEIKSPVKGILQTLKSINDGVFSEEMLGPGFAVIPEENIVHSPIKGRITTLYPTGHAFGIEGEDGTNILVHVGINSALVGGEGFDVKVERWQTVKAGEPLVQVDFKGIKDKITSTSVIVIVMKGSKTQMGSIANINSVEIDTTITEVFKK